MTTRRLTHRGATLDITAARMAWLRVMIPQLWAAGFDRLAAEYQVELDRLEAARDA